METANSPYLLAIGDKRSCFMTTLSAKEDTSAVCACLTADIDPTATIIPGLPDDIFGEL